MWKTRKGKPAKLPELQAKVDSKNYLQSYLPKQVDWDKILKIIQRKVLKGTHLSVTVKEIQPGYLYSLYIKDVYLYIAQNMVLYHNAAIRTTEIITERFLLLDSLLYRHTTTHEKESGGYSCTWNLANRIIAL